MVAKTLSRLEDKETGFRWYYVEGSPPSEWYVSVTTVLKLIVDRRLKSYFIRTGEAEQKQRREQTSESGTQLHDLIEQSLMSGSYVVPPHFEKAMSKWSEICNEHRISASQTEFTVYSDKYGYAGTADIIGYYGGVPAVMDVKTGWYDIKTGWQLAAYKQAYEEIYGGSLGMVGFKISRDGYEAKTFPYSTEGMRGCLLSFLAALQTWKGVYFNALKRNDWRWLHVDSVQPA